ncbi:MAG: 1,4-alpha-glucan branching protein GlgB [Opitutales bacterium]|nr:1,4-alpha-glucan branching protein GlgB [Opitutales bacterium]
MGNSTKDNFHFPPTVKEEDLVDFLDDGDPWIFKKIGPRPLELDGISGWSFSLWAPRARTVILTLYPLYAPTICQVMRQVASTGVWEIFIPDVSAGIKYKFQIQTQAGDFLEKADPMAVYSEGPPNNASILYDLRGFTWRDADWFSEINRDWESAPISIYEVHPGSWLRPGMNYRELASALGDYVQDMGFTHIEFLPLNEHPLVESWGYQATGYYGPCHRFGDPHDLMHLVCELHRRRIGVIVDWVPAHFPKDGFALGWFDGNHLYECQEEWKREHRDWGTWVFDYAKPQVRSFLIGSALAWLDRFHMDGLRVDAVASMLYLDYSRGEDWKPNKYGGRENLEAIHFLKQTNNAVRKYFPSAITIAEESTAFPHVTTAQPGESLGFHFKWNLGWMHDVLQFFEAPPAKRVKGLSKLMDCRNYQFTEDFIQVFSHDEVVHEKKSLLMKMAAGEALETKAADLRSLFVLLWGWPGKKTLFMGGEFGQIAEWAVNGSLQWELLESSIHQGLQQLVRDLNRIYVTESTIHGTDSMDEAFKLLDLNDSSGHVLGFLRWGNLPGEVKLFAFNFGPSSRTKSFGVPDKGPWQVEINSSSALYGGDLQIDHPTRVALDNNAQGQPFSIELELPAFSAQILERLN